MLGVAMEDLAVVTLTHELAHAYTHLGCDIDGRPWNNDGFWRSGIPVIEGLAQFYTQTVAKRLADRRPGVQTAFEALLRRQHCTYTCFRSQGENLTQRRKDAKAQRRKGAKTQRLQRDPLFSAERARWARPSGGGGRHASMSSPIFAGRKHFSLQPTDFSLLLASMGPPIFFGGKGKI